MFDVIVLDTAILFTGVGAFLFVLGIQQINALVPDEDRAYMDPLPPLLRLFWPFIRIIAYFGCSNLPYEMLEYTGRRLDRTGVGYMLLAEQFLALRLVSALVFLALALLTMTMLGKIEPIWLAAAPVFGFIFPEIWLNDTRKRRENAVIRTLPVYLDFITMAVEAGLNFQGALVQAMEKAPAGPLRNEFGIVLRDLRAGLPRSEALRRMADRLDISEITSFVSAVIQAEKMGSSLAQVLRLQAEQRRNERFQRAEKMAMEAPVKLIGPLIIFIFPVTFIILGFPIVMKFLSEGLL